MPDFTDRHLYKVENAEFGAQANRIETIEVNGENMPIGINKNVIINNIAKTDKPIIFEDDVEIKGNLITTGYCSSCDKPGKIVYDTNEIFNNLEYNTVPTNERKFCHAEGSNNTSTGYCSHAEGSLNEATGSCAHVEGSTNEASGYFSHAEGSCTAAKGTNCHAEGIRTTAASFAESAIGSYNIISKTSGTTFTSKSNAFVIGNGYYAAGRSNGLRVDYSGNLFALATINSSGTGYAELFEWEDGNTNNEDRIGKFVTFGTNGKIKIAGKEDRILGVITGTPCVVGNSNEEVYNGLYTRDVFDRFTYNYNDLLLINKSYNYDANYIPRIDLPGWDFVGTIGRMIVKDDSSCQVNGYCVCNATGLAANTTSTTTGWRVLKRINSSTIQIWFK